MKRNSLLSVLAICLLFVGCGRIYGPVEQVKAFADEKEDVLSQMATKLAASPNDAGFDEARKIFDAKKESLKAKKAAIEAAPQGFNADWQSMLRTTEARHEKMFSDMGIKYKAASYCDTNELCRTKWSQLEKDFKGIASGY